MGVTACFIFRRLRAVWFSGGSSPGITVNPFEVEVVMYFDLKRIVWKKSCDRIAGQSGLLLADEMRRAMSG